MLHPYLIDAGVHSRVDESLLQTRTYSEGIVAQNPDAVRYLPNASNGVLCYSHPQFRRFASSIGVHPKPRRVASGVVGGNARARL